MIMIYEYLKLKKESLDSKQSLSSPRNKWNLEYYNQLSFNGHLYKMDTSIRRTPL